MKEKCQHSFDWNGDEIWEYLNQDIAAIAMGEGHIPFGYENIPARGETGWNFGNEFFCLRAFRFHNVPDDWRESLRLRPDLRPKLGYEDWRAKYYPVPASEMADASWEECMDASLLRWRGQRPGVLAKYGLKIKGQHLVALNGAKVLDLSCTCPLCTKGTAIVGSDQKCSVCPVTRCLGRDCLHTWCEFCVTGNIEPMIALLESVQAKMKTPKRGSPEYWAARSDWAEWAAEDANGCDYEFEEKPSINEKLGEWVDFDGNHEFINQDQPNPGWRNSLIRRPFRWQEPAADTPVDTLVWARGDKRYGWNRRHYSSPGMCWNNGTTSFTMVVEASWSHIVLANPEDPGMVPPMDWEPSNAK